MGLYIHGIQNIKLLGQYVKNLKMRYVKVAVSKSFRNTIRMSNSFDPDQVRHAVGPDLGSNCLQKLLAADTSRQRVKF